MRHLLSGVVLLVSTVLPCVAAGEQVASLKGISRLRAKVVGPTVELEQKTGIGSGSLAEQVELRLNENGIGIVSNGTSLQERFKDGDPSLLLAVSVVPATGDHCIYSVDLSVAQLVTLLRRGSGGKDTDYASTWDPAEAKLGIAGCDTVRGEVRQATDDLLDEFLEDYRTANRDN